MALTPTELLKVAHHGSDASTSTKFLTAVTPQVAVISVGAENAYGHPGAETLSRLVDTAIAVHRTDLAKDSSFTFLPEGFAPEPILIYFPLIRSSGKMVPKSAVDQVRWRVMVPAQHEGG